MSIVILRLAAAIYAISTAAYVLYFARPKHKQLATVGVTALSVAFVIHAVAIGVGCAEFGGNEFFSLRGGVVLGIFLATGAYLLVQKITQLPTLGAFITPFILVALLPALFGTPGHPELPPEVLRRPTVTLHILTATLGDGLFAFAFLASIAYLIQEREVKGKHFGLMFIRLPSLDSLDRIVQRLVRAGFLVYTVALVAGTMTATAVWKSAWSWDPRQVLSMLVWLLYGVMVQLRHSGWHGRRFALMNIPGIILVLGSMAALQIFPGTTRHTGSYGTTAETEVRP
jgi:ABC-type transport system involved in cytochrome c biogenesis permease subunit